MKDDERYRRAFEESVDEDLARHLIELQLDLHLGRDLGTAKNSSHERKKMRRALLNVSEKDSDAAWERVIGTDDLVSINYLARGVRAARAVCRIAVPMPGGMAHGTGFLVAPHLLITNNHVLASRAMAAQAEAEFDHELDVDSVPVPTVRFNLAAHEIFLTDTTLDITLVSVAPLSDTGVPLDRFGFLPLIPLSGKGLHGEWVTIVQHPDGDRKMLAVRENQLLEVDRARFAQLSARFIHYTTDTKPGSSGSPVLNDQWQVVAIHHKAIPNPYPAPAAILDDPKEEAIVSAWPKGYWLANEGVRALAVSKWLEQRRYSDMMAVAALDRIAQSIGIVPLPAPASASRTAPEHFEMSRPKPATHWTGLAARPDMGYDANFLPEPFAWGDIVRPLEAELATAKDGSKRLDYLHFSVAINARRKFAAMTAVNIWGAKLVNPGNRSDKWRRDIRMDDDVQPADNFYVKDKGTDPVQFSRGHLVRQFDPCWGTKADAETAEMHTFHFANAAPQVQAYNNSDWGDLEDYVLERAQTRDLKMSVFSGPIFRDDDPVYGQSRQGGPWKIPVSYWKIVAVEKTPGEIAVAAFIVGQIEYVMALYESRVFTSLSPYSIEEIRERNLQVTVKTVEDETGLNFAALRPFDAQGAPESTRHARFVTRPGDIVI